MGWGGRRSARLDGAESRRIGFDHPCRWHADAGVQPVACPQQRRTAVVGVLPNEIGWTPRIELAPLTPVPGWYTIVVQLGEAIVGVDYLIADGRVVE